MPLLRMFLANGIPFDYSIWHMSQLRMFWFFDLHGHYVLQCNVMFESTSFQKICFSIHLNHLEIICL
ncbi:MAG: hypothetical protein DWH94_00320 [Planctomycetota bacterium]|nr:MAG: hypothetical protein DWH94_00320 [Planctomycetota bacterium]